MLWINQLESQTCHACKQSAPPIPYWLDGPDRSQWPQSLVDTDASSKLTTLQEVEQIEGRYLDAYTLLHASAFVSNAKAIDMKSSSIQKQQLLFSSSFFWLYHVRIMRIHAN